MLPVNWFLAQEGLLDGQMHLCQIIWTDFQFLQCMANLYGRTLLPLAALETCGRNKPLDMRNQWMLEVGLGW